MLALVGVPNELCSFLKLPH